MSKTGNIPESRSGYPNACALVTPHVVLEGVATLRYRLSDLPYGTPPVVVISSHKDLLTRSPPQPRQVIPCFVQAERPRQVTSQEDQILIPHPVVPVPGDAPQMPVPVLSEHVHTFSGGTGHVEISDGVDLHGSFPLFQDRECNPGIILARTGTPPRG